MHILCIYHVYIMYLCMYVCVYVCIYIYKRMYRPSKFSGKATLSDPRILLNLDVQTDVWTGDVREEFVNSTPKRLWWCQQAQEKSSNNGTFLKIRLEDIKKQGLVNVPPGNLI